MHYIFRLTLGIILILSLLVACASEENHIEPTSPPTMGIHQSDQNITRPVGWNESTHSNNIKPNYEVVFPENKVNQITITLTPENWAAMQANMTDIFGEPGTRGPGLPQIGAFPAVPDSSTHLTNVLTAEGNLPFMPPGGPGGLDFSAENPIWVEASISFNGSTWTNVGVRYKGNSSLISAWSSKSQKLPLKLDFDQFEDTYPEIDNQRFYGFKQLSLANGFGDASYLRETFAYDLLASAELPAAETAFYEVTLDYGEGSQNLGLYVAIEVVDDTVIRRTFNDASGNIYEGDGQAASFAEGTKEHIQESFQKESNKNTDWTDIEKLYDVLHSDTRTTDPATWRAELEAIFDVEVFLEWLAISTILQHWDSYGVLPHNYYLYHNPETGTLTWISWDHNLILGAMEQAFAGGFPLSNGELPEGFPPPNADILKNAPFPGNLPFDPNNPDQAGKMFDRFKNLGSVTFDKADTDATWPLIRYLLDDPTYYKRYLAFIQTTLDTQFKAEDLTANIQQQASLIKPYMTHEELQAYDTTVQTLIDTIASREQAAREFLATQK